MAGLSQGVRIPDRRDEPHIRSAAPIVRKPKSREFVRPQNKKARKPTYEEVRSRTRLTDWRKQDLFNV